MGSNFPASIERTMAQIAIENFNDPGSVISLDSAYSPLNLCIPHYADGMARIAEFLRPTAEANWVRSDDCDVCAANSVRLLPEASELVTVRREQRAHQERKARGRTEWREFDSPKAV